MLTRGAEAMAGNVLGALRARRGATGNGAICASFYINYHYFLFFHIIRG